MNNLLVNIVLVLLAVVFGLVILYLLWKILFFLLVIGAFTWDDDADFQANTELDVLEATIWGDESLDTNMQHVIQPCSQCPGCSHCQRFLANLDDDNMEMTHYLYWKEGYAEFRSYYGNHLGENPPASDLADVWVVTGEDVPVHTLENFRFNLWLMNGLVPSDGFETEVVVSDFLWQDAPPEWILDNPPEINLLGDSVVNLEVFSEYTDSGATAFDVEDGDLTSSIQVANEVDTNVLGEYSVTYSVTDSFGNVVSAVRTVNVVDTTPPVITLLGDNPMHVEVGSEFVDPGVTVVDNYDDSM